MLASVSNLIAHPDLEVRSVAASGMRMLSKLGDVGAVQALARHMSLQADSEIVREAAKFVTVPTADPSIGMTSQIPLNVRASLFGYACVVCVDDFVAMSTY